MVNKCSVWVLFCVLGMTLACQPTDPIEELISHLRSDFGNRREKACRRLGKLGAQAAKAVPALRKVLRSDRSDYVRRCAAEALGLMAPSGVAAFPELTRAFKDRAGGVRMAAAEAIGRHKDKALPLLKKLMYGKDGYAQLYALRALKHVGPAGLPLLAHASKSRYLQVLQTASETLIDVGRKFFSPPKTDELRNIHGRYFKTLFSLLRVRNDKIRRHVSWALSELGPHGASASAALCEQLLVALNGVLESAPNQVKMYAAYSLRQLGRKGAKDAATKRHLQQAKSWPAVIDRLLVLRRDNTWYIRKHAVSALGWMLQALRPSEKADKRLKASFQRYQKRAFLAMKDALNDATWDVRYEAARALRRLGTRGVFDAFLASMRSRNPERREHSAQTLGWMGKQAVANKQHQSLLTSRVFPALWKALSDPSKAVQKAAKTAFVAIGKPAVEWLLPRHAKGSADVRRKQYDILRRVARRAVSTSVWKTLDQWVEDNDKSPHLQLVVWRVFRHQMLLSGAVCRDALRGLSSADSARRRRSIGILSRCSGKDVATWRERLWHKVLKGKDRVESARALLSLALLAGQKPVALTKEQRQHLATWGSLQAPESRQARLLAMPHLSKRPVLSWLLLIKKSLASPRAGVREAAVRALAKWPLDRQTVPVLLLAAANASPVVRHAALAALGRFFPLKGRPHRDVRLNWKMTTTRILPGLFKLLKHIDAKTREQVLRTLERLPLVYALSVIPVVLQSLRDSNAGVRARALYVLSWQLPLLQQRGWTIPYLRMALQAPEPAATLFEIRRQGKVPAKERAEAIAWLQKKLPLPTGTVPPLKQIDVVVRDVYRAIGKCLKDRSAFVRKYAIFAYGNIGKYSSAKRKSSILKRLLKALQGRSKAHVKRNVCWVLGRWIAPNQTAAMIKAMKRVQLDSKAPKAARAQCEAAISQLKSDDKPYTLWVNHPRSPTLETFAPENLYPQGP